MQNSAAPFTLSTLAYILAALATIFTNIATALITYLFTRPKQSAEIHKTNAETGKTQAETRQIDSEILFQAFKRLDDLETITHTQTGEIIALQRAKGEVEWKLSLSEQREKIHLEELLLAQAELDMLRPKKPFQDSGR